MFKKPTPIRQRSLEAVKADFEKQPKLVLERIQAQKDQYNRFAWAGSRAKPKDQAKLRQALIAAEVKNADWLMEAHHGKAL